MFQYLWLKYAVVGSGSFCYRSRLPNIMGVAEQAPIHSAVAHQKRELLTISYSQNIVKLKKIMFTQKTISLSLTLQHMSADLSAAAASEYFQLTPPEATITFNHLT